ncbi:HET domain-containing protein [Aspergillus clavatus NRRL 1]|uniref:HET domain protein n=1 Tax=Aspergillus clavatus (strain ATCC 1007 / CBS 513.65 / DSM 816 / NCTC 3887 / NRRL 1 / QM 1276 / 107) TaxID=344612 RepID=A1C8S1_ASPCL|nr:HET domain protein [Aspergillus clavatus NRRL 1]EAW13708.1 HET domain protein [Aspergillus clavatus NRRL 1]
MEPNPGKYQYRPLSPGPNSIRMLRLLSDPDSTAQIHCQLFNYSLSETRRGTHLYEALSYVWGDTAKPQSIFIDGRSLAVTANLHAALLHLRDPVIDRVMWIDAICINQDDLEERGSQVQLMARIYTKADRVVVWLGQAAEHSDVAMEAIRAAASRENVPKYDVPLGEGIQEVLGRPWFRRIWVLQEVAAARQIRLHCGFAELDGYTFCDGLSLLSQQFAHLLHLHRVVDPVIYLMKGAIFRRKTVQSSGVSRVALNIRPLGELVEMYHGHEATERHDKIFALLGMSSDDPIAAGLLPDYKAPWEETLARLVNFLFGHQIIVHTGADRELAVIQGKGVLIGKVSEVSGNNGEDEQNVKIASTTPSARSIKLSVRRLPNPIRVGDFVTLLTGASKPTIIRPCRDHFAIVRAQISLELQSAASPTLHNFLLIWDWEGFPSPSTEGFEYQRLVGSIPFSDTTYSLGMDRLWHMALVLDEAQEHRMASTRLSGTVTAHIKELGEAHLRTLTCMHKAAVVYIKADELAKVETLFERVIALSMRRQELDQITLSSLSELAVLYVMQGRGREVRRLRWMEKIINLIRNGTQTMDEIMVHATQVLDKESMTLVFDLAGNDIQVTSDMLILIAKDPNGVEIMQLVIDRQGSDIKITDDVVAAAARNSSGGEAIMKLLLDQREDEVRGSENVLIAAAANSISGCEIIRLLLSRKADEIVVTGAVVSEAGQNAAEEFLTLLFSQGYPRVKFTTGAIAQIARHFDHEVMMMLLEREGERLRPTADILVAAAGSHYGRSVLKVLLDNRGNDIQITEDVIVAAIGSRHAESVVQLLLDRKAQEVELSKPVIVAAAKSWSGKKVMKLLLRAKASQVGSAHHIVLEITKHFDVEIMSLVLDAVGGRIEITGGMVSATVGNTSGEEILRLFFHRRRNKVRVSEDAVVQVALSCTHEMMRFLLDRMQDKIEITDQLLIAAARNKHGTAMLRLLLDRADKGNISDELAIAVIRQGADELKLLLDKREQRIHVTEGMLVAAAGHWYAKEMLRLLFDKTPGELEITEKVVIAAAGNKRGKDAMQLLINKVPDSVQLTKNVAAAAARNRHGEDIVHLLRSHDGGMAT